MRASLSGIVSGSDQAHSFIVFSGPGTSLLRCPSREGDREGERESEREGDPFVCANLALAAGSEIKINMWHWLKLAVLYCQKLQLGLVARRLLPPPCSPPPCSSCSSWHPMLHNFNLFSPLLGFLLNLPRRLATI